MKAFFEQMFFQPKWYHYLFIVLLSPLSFLYGIGMWLRRKFTKKVSYEVPIISVGNLIVGGSGKTPFTIALAQELEGVYIISRGYGRESQGLVQVSKEGKVLTDVKRSGDEAMLMARTLENASVIVSEDRHKAIRLAQKQGAKVIILDDGFNRVDIQKFEILLESDNVPNSLPFPAGPFREFTFTKAYADVVVREGEGFLRKVEILDASERMLLVTAISNPSRLHKYLPSNNVVGQIIYDDHAYFEEEVLVSLLKKYDASSLLCTSKDRVKMQGFKLAISEMKLKLEIKKEIRTQIQTYIKGYKHAK